jgi:methionine-S-sulfoxide reductase
MLPFLLATACAAPPGADTRIAPVPLPKPGQEAALFAGGCFWCLEADMDKLLGVVSTTSGFAGGTDPNPTYDTVGHVKLAPGEVSHTEAVWVVYDPSIVTYAKVLDWFLKHVDPTDAGGQFCDRGEQYRPAIFPQNDGQAGLAQNAVAALDASAILPAKVALQVVPGQTFHAAENYHQDFAVRNQAHYQAYRAGCGRDDKVAKVWAKALAH